MTTIPIEDLNLPRALAVLWEVVRGDLPDAVKKATVLRLDPVLGLGLAQWSPPEQIIPAEIVALADERQGARQQKDWARADQLRAQIQEAGYDIEDRADGPRLRQR